MKSRVLFCGLCLVAIFQVVIFPSIYMQAFFAGLSLFCEKLLPLLFPFFLLCGVLVKTGVLFEISNRFFATPSKKLGLSQHFPYVFILACLSGYPMNAKLTKDLYENGGISTAECTSLCFATSCSGVLFLCGTVGGMMFYSSKIGVSLFFCHAVACLCGYFTYSAIAKLIFKTPPCNFSNRILPAPNKQSFNLVESVTESMASAISSILLVGGYVCVFSVICKMIEKSGAFTLLSPLATGVFQGIFEITMGISTIASLDVSPLSLALVGGIVSFGGISINLQSLALLSPCGVSGKQYFILKALQAVWGFFLTLLCFWLVGV